jgi:hypothetical protein
VAALHAADLPALERLKILEALQSRASAPIATWASPCHWMQVRWRHGAM